MLFNRKKATMHYFARCRSWCINGDLLKYHETGLYKGYFLCQEMWVDGAGRL